MIFSSALGMASALRAEGKWNRLLIADIGKVFSFSKPAYRLVGNQFRIRLAPALFIPHKMALGPRYKDQSVIDVQRNNRCLS